MFTLENETLLVNIQAKGAELTRILHRENGIDYLWDANPKVWGKHSPVLFPIVGALKENKYYFEGKEYNLPRHGFARDRVFTPGQQTKTSIVFTLRNDADSAAVYPFAFAFSIRYSLQQNRLSVTYEVTNESDSGPIYFSVGGHPAFRLPLESQLHYDDYLLHFNEKETTGRWPISEEGLIETSPEPLLQHSYELQLSKALFSRDALVLKDLRSDNVQLKNPYSSHGIRFHFGQFPYLGLWAAPGADFLCIEPWCGIADSVDHNQQLEDKEGINYLRQGELFSATWSVEMF